MIQQVSWSLHQEMFFTQQMPLLCFWLMQHNTDTCFMCQGKAPGTTKLTYELNGNCLATVPKTTVPWRSHTWDTCLIKLLQFKPTALLEALLQKSWTHVAQIHWRMLQAQPAFDTSEAAIVIPGHQRCSRVICMAWLLTYQLRVNSSTPDLQRLSRATKSFWQMTGLRTLEVVDTCNCSKHTCSPLTQASGMFGQTLGKCHPASDCSPNAGSASTETYLPFSSFV